MKRFHWWLFLVLLPLCSGCNSTTVTPPQPTAAVAPTVQLNMPSVPVHFTTSDHVQLAGALYGHGKTAVICSHMFGTTDNIWVGTGLPQRLATLGYQVLIYNFRGYGTSEGTENEALMDVDLQAAVHFMQRQGATRIVLMGASMGGTASLKVASEMSVAAVISISGPRVFQISLIDSELKSLNMPKLFMAGRDDESFVYDSEYMESVVSPPKEIYIYPGSEHGTDLFNGNYGDDPAQRVLHFIQQYAPAS